MSKVCLSNITKLYGEVQDQLYRPKEYDVYFFLEHIEDLNRADNREIYYLTAAEDLEHNQVNFWVNLVDGETLFYCFDKG